MLVAVVGLLLLVLTQQIQMAAMEEQGLRLLFLDLL
jgi:hypothetical protein